MGWGLGLVIFELRSKWCKGLERKRYGHRTQARIPRWEGADELCTASSQRAARGPPVSLSSGSQKPVCSEVKVKLASWRSGVGPLNPKRKKETHRSTGSTETEEIKTLPWLKSSAPSKYYSSPALNAKDTQLSECSCLWEQAKLL